MKRLALLLAALPALSACSSEEEPVDPVSASEAEALDEAATMLEEKRLPPDAVKGPDDGNGSGDTDQPIAQGESQ